MYMDSLDNFNHSVILPTALEELERREREAEEERRREEQRRRIEEQRKLQEQSQAQSGGNSSNMPSWSTVESILDQFMSSGSEEGLTAIGEGDAAGTAGESGGSWGTLGWVAAAIVAQHELTKRNDRQINGKSTGDAFSGDFATEPWLAYLSNAAGNGPTAGEKFDAAFDSNSLGDMARTYPGASTYWANPIDGIAGQIGEWAGGKTGKVIMNPVGALWDLLAGD